MTPKQNFNSRSDIIDALKESMNIQDDKTENSGIQFVGETGSVVVNDNKNDFETLEQADAMAKQAAEDKLTFAKMTEEELFAELLKQKRN